MDGLRRSIQGNFSSILLILVTGGFLVLLVELVLFQHWQGLQLIGLGSVVLALILTIAGMFVEGGGANVIGILLVVISLVGLVGVFEHYQARQQEVAAFQRFSQGQGGFPGGQAGTQATGQQANGQQANGQQANSQQSSGQQANAVGTPAPVQEGGQATGRQNGQGGGQFGGQGGFQRGRGRFGAGAAGGLSFREPVPPPLAPLSLSGLSLLAALAVLGSSRKVTTSESEQVLANPSQFEQGAVKG